MDNPLHYSPLALADLEEILDYFFIELENPSKGEEVVNEILEAVTRIPGHATRFPRVGPLPFTDDEYRFVAVGSYIAFFRASDDDVYVDRILYKRRDFSALLQGI